MTREEALRRAAEIQEEVATLNAIPEAAATLLDRELERLELFHRERCCTPRLTPEQSAMHREARGLALGLHGFFAKRRAALKQELIALRKTLH